MESGSAAQNAALDQARKDLQDLIASYGESSDGESSDNSSENLETTDQNAEYNWFNSLDDDELDIQLGSVQPGAATTSFVNGTQLYRSPLGSSRDIRNNNTLHSARAPASFAASASGSFAASNSASFIACTSNPATNRGAPFVAAASNAAFSTDTSSIIAGPTSGATAAAAAAELYASVATSLDPRQVENESKITSDGSDQNSRDFQTMESARFIYSPEPSAMRFREYDSDAERDYHEQTLQKAAEMVITGQNHRPSMPKQAFECYPRRTAQNTAYFSVGNGAQICTADVNAALGGPPSFPRRGLNSNGVNMPTNGNNINIHNNAAMENTNMHYNNLVKRHNVSDKYSTSDNSGTGKRRPKERSQYYSNRYVPMTLEDPTWMERHIVPGIRWLKSHPAAAFTITLVVLLAILACIAVVLVMGAFPYLMRATVRDFTISATAVRVLPPSDYRDFVATIEPTTQLVSSDRITLDSAADSVLVNTNIISSDVEETEADSESEDEDNSESTENVNIPFLPERRNAAFLNSPHTGHTKESIHLSVLPTIKLSDSNGLQNRDAVGLNTPKSDAINTVASQLMTLSNTKINNDSGYVHDDLFGFEDDDSSSAYNEFAIDTNSDLDDPSVAPEHPLQNSIHSQAALKPQSMPLQQLYVHSELTILPQSMEPTSTNADAPVSTRAYGVSSASDTEPYSVIIVGNNDEKYNTPATHSSLVSEISSNEMKPLSISYKPINPPHSTVTIDGGIVRPSSIVSHLGITETAAHSIPIATTTSPVIAMSSISAGVISPAVVKNLDLATVSSHSLIRIETVADESNSSTEQASMKNIGISSSIMAGSLQPTTLSQLQIHSNTPSIPVNTVDPAASLKTSTAPKRVAVSAPITHTSSSIISIPLKQPTQHIQKASVFKSSNPVLVKRNGNAIELPQMVDQPSIALLPSTIDYLNPTPAPQPIYGMDGSGLIQIAQQHVPDQRQLRQQSIQSPPGSFFMRMAGTLSSTGPIWVTLHFTEPLRMYWEGTEVGIIETPEDLQITGNGHHDWSWSPFKVKIPGASKSELTERSYLNNVVIGVPPLSGAVAGRRDFVKRDNSISIADNDNKVTSKDDEPDNTYSAFRFLKEIQKEDSAVTVVWKSTVRASALGLHTDNIGFEKTVTINCNVSKNCTVIDINDINNINNNADSNVGNYHPF